MKRFGMLSGLAAVVLALAGSARAGDGLTLRYKLAEGDRQIYQTTSSMQQKQTVAGQNLDTTFTMKEVTVRSLEDQTDAGHLKIASRNERLSFTANIPQVGEYAYNSEESDRDAGNQLAEELNKVFERLDEATITFTMTPRGEVQSVTGFQELLADILKENPIGAQFVGGGSDEAHKMGLLERLLYFPEEPVEPGDTWDQTLDAKLPNLGTMKARRSFKYEGPGEVGDRTTARISVTTEMSFDLDLDQNGVKVTGTLKTTNGEGTAEFDPEAGKLLSYKSSVELSGELNVNAGGMVIPVATQQTQRTTTELLEKLPE